MSKDQEPLKQQILFDEPHFDDVEAEDEIKQQVILPDNAWQSVEEVIEESLDEDVKSRPRWLWRIAASAFTVLCGYELFDFFRVGFSESPFITSIYAILFGSVGMISSLALLNEFRGLLQFKKQINTQQKAQLLLDNSKVFDGKAFCQKINQSLPLDVVTEQEQSWLKTINEQLTEAEVVELYATNVLSKVDEQALKQIAKFSTESVMLVAISPVALIDMLVLMWRNLRMIDKIAGLYGMHLGYWSRIKLLKQVFSNMIYAGASEIVADVGLDMLGVESLGKISTRAAQGLGAGMLTARLGIRAIHLSRPIPFQQDAPKLAQVRNAVIEQVKQLLLDKSKTTLTTHIKPKSKIKNNR